MQDFQQRNPNFYVFNAVLHLDEATPHLHIDYMYQEKNSAIKDLDEEIAAKSSALIETIIALESIQNLLEMSAQKVA